MLDYKTGDKIRGYDIAVAQVDRWIELPLKCHYFTILYLVGHLHLFDWEALDVKWWKGELWD